MTRCGVDWPFDDYRHHFDITSGETRRQLPTDVGPQDFGGASTLYTLWRDLVKLISKKYAEWHIPDTV